VRSGPAVLRAQAVFAALATGTVCIALARLSRNSWNTRVHMPAIARSTVVVVSVVIVVAGVARSTIVCVVAVTPSVVIDSSVVAVTPMRLTAAVLALQAERAICIERAAGQGCSRTTGASSGSTTRAGLWPMRTIGIVLMQLAAAVFALEAGTTSQIDLAAHACSPGHTCVIVVTAVTRTRAMLALEATPAFALQLTAAKLVQALRAAWTVARLRAAQLSLRAVAAA
jgi:hypothetical protein